MVKVNIHQLLTIAVLQFTINDKTYTGCLVLLIGNLIVGQVVITLKIVKYDTNTSYVNRTVSTVRGRAC